MMSADIPEVRIGEVAVRRHSIGVEIQIGTSRIPLELVDAGDLAHVLRVALRDFTNDA